MDDLVEYKLFLALALKASTGDIESVCEIISAAPLDSKHHIFNKSNILSLLLVILPNSVEPSKLTFIKGFIYDELSSKRNVEELINVLSGTELEKLDDREVLEQQFNTLSNYIDIQAIKFSWNQHLAANDSEKQRIFFNFVKSRTLKVSELYNENVFFNRSLLNLLPKADPSVKSWQLGLLNPLDFIINYYIKNGIHGALPNLLIFQNGLSSKENFNYLIKFMDKDNIDEFLINCIIPYVKYNNNWRLLNGWLEDKNFITSDDYDLVLKMFEFFFNNYLVTQDYDNEVLNFLNKFIIDYLFKVYSSNALTHETLSLMSETIQYFIGNNHYFKQFHNDSNSIDFQQDFDHNIIDDQYIKTHFCNNTLPSLEIISSLIDSISKLIKIGNNNEILMSITQILLIAISSSEIQLNFAKFLIHNYKVNDDLENHVDSYNNWENFLINFNWLIDSSVLFKKIQNYACINKINEILFEILLNLNYNGLIEKYLLINFNSNANFKKILLKYCWQHYIKADNFSLKRGELLTVVEFLKNFDLQLETEIADANNFFVANKSKLDIYESSNDAKFFDFESSLVKDKSLSEFATSDLSLHKISNIKKDFDSCDDLNFEILKLKKLLIASNQLVINYKFQLQNSETVIPVDIYRLNNPLVIMEKILELNAKSYLDMAKLYKTIVDFCISLDKVALIFDVSYFESANLNGTENYSGDFDSFELYDDFFVEDGELEISTQELELKKNRASKIPHMVANHKYPLKDKLISSCINSSLIDLNFEFAYENSMKLLNNETGTSSESLGYIWLTIFQVCKFVDPSWMITSFNDDFEDEEFGGAAGEPDDHIEIPLTILTQQIEIISKLLEVVPSSTSISATENKIILNHANYLTNKYHKKLNSQVVNDFNNYQYQQSSSIFKNFNASTGTLLNQFTKNASNLNIASNNNNNSNLTINRRNYLGQQQDSINSSPISAFASPRNSQVESSANHSAIPLGRGTPVSQQNAGGLENRFVRAFTSSASEIFKNDAENGNEQPGMSNSASNSRLNLIGGEEQIKNLFVSGLGWAIGANPHDTNR